MKSEDDKLPASERRMHRVRFLITFGDLTQEQLAKAKQVGFTVYSFAHVLEVGKANIDKVTL